MKTDIKFLDIENVLRLHEKLISKFGGMHGLRDRGLLESAVSQPVMTAFGPVFASGNIFNGSCLLFSFNR